MHKTSLYSDLSYYYDVLCSNIDYREQCEFALRANKLWGNGGRSYLDLACGSGKLLSHVAAAGFDCSGLDISADMLLLAARQCPQAQLICSDMSSLNTPAAFDLVSCFLYSIHYCASIAALQQTFEQVYTALTPGGLFCFDTVDKDRIANDRGHEYQAMLPEGRLRFHNRWNYCGSGDRLELHIDIHEYTAGGQRHYSECHAMTAVNVSAIQHLLETTGFSVVVLEHDFTRLAAWQGSSGNVVFCATRPA